VTTYEEAMVSAFDLILSTPVDPSGFTGGLGGPGSGGHVSPDWFIQYGMDIGGDEGTAVYAAFDGHVTVYHPHVPKSDSHKVYGAQIFMRAPDDMMGGFYTHITDVPADLSVGSSVSRGDYLGVIYRFSDISPHLHLALVEIIGGLPGGRYMGVSDLYDWFLALEEPGGDGSGTVTFNQDGSQPTPA
jgi:hypothetical protein